MLTTQFKLMTGYLESKEGFNWWNALTRKVWTLPPYNSDAVLTHGGIAFVLTTLTPPTMVGWSLHKHSMSTTSWKEQWKQKHKSLGTCKWVPCQFKSTPPSSYSWWDMCLSTWKLRSKENTTTWRVFPQALRSILVARDCSTLKKLINTTALYWRLLMSIINR